MYGPAEILTAQQKEKREIVYRILDNLGIINPLTKTFLYGRGVILPSKSKLFYNITLLDKTGEHLKQNNDLWEKRKARYKNTNDYCNENYLYNSESDVLHEAKCKCYNCERCRPIKKYDLLRNIVNVSEKHNLRRHLVITLPGYPFRSLFCNADESFDYAMKKFNEFRVLYKRNFGKNLSYICLPRSQSDGFCHLHILGLVGCCFKTYQSCFSFYYIC
jgi:hypothetical protein